MQPLTRHDFEGRHDFFWCEDFSSPRQRLSVKAISFAERGSAEDDAKQLTQKGLANRCVGCYTVHGGGQFAALPDHSTPMRSPNEVGAGAIRAGERFKGTVRRSTTDAVSGRVYDEDVFQYFLEIERRRSHVSGQPFLLLVIDSSGDANTIDSRIAHDVLAALAKSVRDTDFVGWYSQGRAIGAVLIQSVDLSRVDAAARVTARLSAALSEQLAPGVVERLRFRLCQVRAQSEIWI